MTQNAALRERINMTMTRRNLTGFLCRVSALVVMAWALPATAMTPDEAAVLKDRPEGKDDAPVTMIEYASLSCGHCAHFQKEILPELREKYVATGKVKLIYRDYPTDGVALKAAAVARCMPESSYHAYLNVLFENQKNWVLEEDPVKQLSQYARLGGLSPAEAEACAKSDKLMDAIADERLKADQMYGVTATPTFVLNNGKDKIEGALPFTQFAAKIDALLAEAAPAQPDAKAKAATEDKKDAASKPEAKPADTKIKNGKVKPEGKK